MKNHKQNILGIIPARAGSQSIKNKNVALLGGKPLIEWVIDAAKKSEFLNLLVCSTDMDDAKVLCEKKGVKWLDRPEHLRNGDFPIVNLVTHILGHIANPIEAVALLQPTSPFVTGEQIDRCINMLKDYTFESVQTITEMPHNHHAYNQREYIGKTVKFVFEKEREICYNKQTKPDHYVFGNLVVTKTKSLHKGLFAKPSGGILIDRYHALDVDGPEDIELANWYVEHGKISS